MSDSTLPQIKTAQLPDITGELPFVEGVCFDPDGVSLQGVYRDELSLFRARKIWTETLERTFLLERARDFDFNLWRDYECKRFVLKCSFLTACGRYAFWRLTNDQAPEAQYEIETAHIPDSLSRHDDFISAPDLKPVPGVIPRSAFEAKFPRSQSGNDKSFAQWLQEILEKITKSL